MKRRDFLKHTGAIGAGAALAQLGALTARAQTAGDYKALVCIFLYGGNDGNNTIVPIDAAGYANYAAARGGIALPQSGLLPLADPSGNASFGMHASLGADDGLQAMWNAKNLAFVTNVGTLVAPLTKAQYLSATSAKPQSLFSHIDQQLQWQASLSDAPSNTGWGGRLADQLASLNTGASIPTSISTAGNNLFVTGSATRALSIPTSGTFGLSGYGSTSTGTTARLSALKALLGIDRGTDLLDAAQDIMTGALQSSAVLGPILKSNSTTVSGYFSALTSNISQQLHAVAKVIEARGSLGMTRQVFLVNIGSFDTHGGELGQQGALFADLGVAVKAFHDSMTAIGTGNSVTSFSLSDFSRTFQSNTSAGTDHGWGSNHFVAGGAVKGGQFYGTWPTLAIGGPDDVGQGRWIPTTAVDQYAATLASWFGASGSTLASVLPNIAAFSPATLGFV
jgi:uncharacterized protein (DUF1501 family)